MLPGLYASVVIEDLNWLNTSSVWSDGSRGVSFFFNYNFVCRLSASARKDAAVKHALSVRRAVTSGNYVMFFRLYKTAPNLNTLLMGVSHSLTNLLNI